MLKVSNLDFKYNKKEDYILKDISFLLENNKINIILGENGIGKTTLIKLIIGLLKPIKGEIYLDNLNLLSLKNKVKAKLISYVPQNIVLSGLSVYETLLSSRISNFNYFPSKLDKDKVNKVIKELELDLIKDRNVNSLSGGEKQKVAIAMSLVNEPKFIIFDEPTGNLDIKNEMNVLSIAQKICYKFNIGVLISIHNLNAAFNYGDYFLLLKDKSIKYKGNKDILTKENLSDIFNIKLEINSIDNKNFIYIGE